MRRKLVGSRVLANLGDCTIIVGDSVDGTWVVGGVFMASGAFVAM